MHDAQGRTYVLKLKAQLGCHDYHRCLSETCHDSVFYNNQLPERGPLRSAGPLAQSHSAIVPPTKDGPDIPSVLKQCMSKSHLSINKLTKLNSRPRFVVMCLHM